MKNNKKNNLAADDARVAAMTQLLRECGDSEHARATAQAALNSAFLPIDSVMAVVRVSPETIIADLCRQ
jgi:hypothetical protein